jgi:hypothetical protein
MRYHHKEYLVAHIPTKKISRSRLHTLMIAIYAKYMLTADEAVRGLLNPLRRKSKNWCQPLIALHEGHDEPNTIIIPSGGDWVHAIVRRPGDPVQTDLPPPPGTEIVPE